MRSVRVAGHKDVTIWGYDHEGVNSDVAERHVAVMPAIVEDNESKGTQVR